MQVRALIASIFLSAACTVPAAHAADPANSIPAAPEQAAASKFRNVGVKEFDELRKKPGTVVLDVRTPAEFAKGHILGAVNVPFATLTDRVAELKSSYGDRPVIVCCEHGRQSGQAGAALKKNGFARPLGLAGGLTAWRGAGLPLVRT